MVNYTSKKDVMKSSLSSWDLSIYTRWRATFSPNWTIKQIALMASLPLPINCVLQEIIEQFSQPRLSTLSLENYDIVVTHQQTTVF